MDNMEDILNTKDDRDCGFFAEVDLKYSDEPKQRTKIFPLAPETKKN